MVTKKIFIIISLAGMVLALALLIENLWSGKSARKAIINEATVNNSDKAVLPADRFKGEGFKTNTSIASIPFDKILNGGPGKDSIPAINSPKFVSIASASSFIEDDFFGMTVTVGKTTIFYPYNIMVWHEIVNHTIEGKALVVTFCPLCGSAMVFDATVDGKVLKFGVSGKLYESNLLMYDTETESLWSQIIGKAVVGEKTGTKLTIHDSQISTFQEFKEMYPKGQVLSKDTGFTRNYSFYPYGDYDTNEKIYFPISINDTRLPAKEIMYIVTVGEISVAFKFNGLKPGVKAIVDVGGQKITAEKKDGEIEVRGNTGEVFPGYHAMWFSWAIHHQKDGVVWLGK